jgi:hypothetical protein
MATELVGAIGSKSDLARLLGVHPSMVTKHIRKGVVEVRSDGKIDLDQAVKSVNARKDPSRGGKGGAPNREPEAPVAKVSTPELPQPKEGSFTFERAQREGLERKLKQLELDRQLGNVVEFAAFAKGMEEAASACRKECEGMVQRLPSLVAAEHDVRRCRDLIEAEVSRAMETLATTCMALAAQRRNATSQ